MNVTLLRALLALVPTCLLFSGSVVLLYKRKTVWSFLQLIGAGCLVIVALIHVSEALDLLLWMHWGLEDSFGHYLDLSSAVLGTRRILPMELRVGDRLIDETGEWEIVGRPYTTAGVKNARVRVQRVGEPQRSPSTDLGALTSGSA